MTALDSLTTGKSASSPAELEKPVSDHTQLATHQHEGQQEPRWRLSPQRCSLVLPLVRDRVLSLSPRFPVSTSSSLTHIPNPVSRPVSQAHGLQLQMNEPVGKLSTVHYCARHLERWAGNTEDLHAASCSGVKGGVKTKTLNYLKIALYAKE